MKKMLFLLLFVISSAVFASKQDFTVIDKSSLLKRDETRAHISYCTGIQEEQVRDASSEAKAMLETTYSRLMDLQIFIDGQSSPLQGNWPTPEIASTAHTYSRLIDPYLIPSLATPMPEQRSTVDGMQDPAFGANRAAAERLTAERWDTLSLFDTFTALVDVMRRDIYSFRYEIICGTSWMSKLNQNNHRASDGSYFDDRFSLPPEMRRWTNIGAIPEQWDIMTWGSLPGNIHIVIALNEEDLAGKWNVTNFKVKPNGVREVHYKDMVSAGYGLREWSLEELQSHHLSAKLFQALATEPLVPSRLRLGSWYHREVSGRSTWEQLTNLAKSRPEWAAKDGHNFRYFVVAMYLKQWDWSSGWNEDPSSSVLQSVQSIGRPSD